MDMLLYAILNKKIKNSGGSGGTTPKKLENTDLNTVIETGFYYGFEGHGCTNTPANARDTDFSMIVVNGDGIVYQIFTRHRDIPEHRLFQRSIDITDSSDLFVCEWAEFATTEDCAVDSVLSETSTRPPQNAIVTKRLNEIESNSAKKTDLTKYLQKSGGVMTGNIDMQTNKKDILVGTQKANVSDGTAVAGGIIEKRTNMASTLPETRSFIGSFHNTDNDKFYNLISVRHRNGYNDGNSYGMYLYSVLTSGDNLRWNKQIASNVWQGDRVLLDSENFTDYALAKDGTAKKAEDLTDSGWIDTTRNISFTNISTVKCRKYGQLVEVRGEVTFSNTNGSPTVCTLPDGYRPATVVQTCGYTPSGKIFGIKVGPAGVVSFTSDADGTFVKNTTYHIDLTYLLG